MNKDSMTISKEELFTAVESLSRTDLEKVLKSLIENMFSIKTIISTTERESPTVGTAIQQTPVTAVQDEDKFSERKVSNVLLDLGIPVSLKGYRCLKTAIPYYAEANGNCSMTKELYPHVAKIHSTTASRVERAIRHAIEVSCDRGNQKLIEEYFGYSVNPIIGKPTNAEFIAAVVEYMRQH